MRNDRTLWGDAEATHTPVADTRRVPVKVCVCDRHVPPAPENAIGHCVYYYRPLHEEYIEKTGVATWQAVIAWAVEWIPWANTGVARRLLKDRDALIQPGSQAADWSRHASFMMRHIGCGHQPPSYYVSYGYYYCSRYGKLLKPSLSQQGKAWLKFAKKLLQRNMEHGLKQNMAGQLIAISCKRYPNRSFQMTVPRLQLELDDGIFKTFAFKTHVPSYLDAGLADLPFSDLTKIGAEPNIEEWLDPKTWEQALESGEEVGKEKARDIGTAVEQALQWLIKKFR